MLFPELFTVWVVRNDTPFFVGVAKSYKEAVEYGNKTISTKEFLIKQYNCSDQVSTSTSVQETRGASPVFSTRLKELEEESDLDATSLKDIVLTD